MTSWVIVLILASAALAYVLKARGGGAERAPDDGSSLADELLARKRAALVAIVDLEEEHAVGKLGATDLQSLRTAYEGEALDALRELGALRDSTFDEEELEMEIAAIREQLKCPNCGSVRSPGQKCERCNA